VITPRHPSSTLAPQEPTAADGPAELARAIRSALGRSGYSALKDVACVVTDGVALLRGRVATYHLKQVAQAAAMGVAGVHPVVNRIDVVISRDARFESPSPRAIEGSDESGPGRVSKESETTQAMRHGTRTSPGADRTIEITILEVRGGRDDRPAPLPAIASIADWRQGRQPDENDATDFGEGAERLLSRTFEG
jgi:hypothetical protein